MARHRGKAPGVSTRRLPPDPSLPPERSPESKGFVLCPHCANPAQLVTGAEVYPHRPDLRSKPYHRCLPCGAHVGCHPGTTKPLGTPANQDLRRARRRAHAAFDPIWQSRRMSRSHAYAWLAGQLGMPADACHIGYLGLTDCQRVVDACSTGQSELVISPSSVLPR